MQNQLIEETIYSYSGTSTTPSNTTSYEYTYDTAGNILSETKNCVLTKNYTYNDNNGNWRDLLTAVNGDAISYDEIGNPLSYTNGKYSYTMQWEQGRQLVEAEFADDRSQYLVSYTYDLDGIRASKLVNGVVHNYVTQNGKVVRETIGTGSSAKVLDFIYDASGRPFALKYKNGTAATETYYYVLNLQGDVVALMTASRETKAEYTYNAWGEILTATGEMANINPLRYRGYYYDAETGFYYLQSRYYDPTIHRFINADSYASTGSGTLGCNMFAYCNNNPVIYKDEIGQGITLTILVLGIKAVVAFVGVTVVCAYICDPGFREAFNNAVFSVVEEFTTGIEVVGGFMVDAAEMFASQCKTISNSVAESFARATERPNYAGKRELHHIVAKMAPNAMQARKILNDVGININSSDNLVSLKAGLHRRLHTNMYYGWANSVVISAYNSAEGDRSKQRKNVLQALNTIKAFLLTMDEAAPF